MNKIVSTNPGKNYAVVGEVEVTSNEEIVRKVAEANAAKEDWRRLGLTKRLEYIQKAYEAFKSRADDIADIITKEVGTPITTCKDEVSWDWSYFEWFLSNAEKILAPETLQEDETTLYQQFYEPIGTAAVITPWNLPFDLFLWGVIPNLLVGNTVIHKASTLCALSGKLFEEIMEGVGFPKGVFSAVHGTSEQGEFLAQQAVDLIWFTGSSDVGKHLYEISGKKFIKAVMEMGGSNPAIIFPDADIDAMVNTIMFKRFAYCGQACDSVKRLIVHKDIFDDVVSKLKEKVEALVVGEPEDSKTQIGPVASAKQLETLVRQVDESVNMGAIVVTGGKKPEGLQGAYYLPTILTNLKKGMPVWREEVFGPVLPIVAFEDEAQAIRMANDTSYGLSAQIYSKNEELITRVSSEIKAGSVDINGASHFKPWNPFGGYKDSGMGREHGAFGIRELCQIKVISQPK